jgi:FdhD protein
MTDESHMFQTVPCLRIDGESHKESVHEIVEELPFALFINGRHAMTAVASPVMLEDLITGYLFTEEVIKAADEIESIKIEKNRISVITKNLFKVTGPKKTIISGCGGSSSYIDVEKLPHIRSLATFALPEIRTRVKEVLASDLHVKTGGIHVVGLVGEDNILARSEDIGRHNALDRVIGYGLRTGIDFSRTFIVCSGRISSEMARKCLVANIPVVASRGATTTLTVDIAKKSGLCVIGFVRSTKMLIYTHPERIEGLDPVSF